MVYLGKDESTEGIGCLLPWSCQPWPFWKGSCVSHVATAQHGLSSLRRQSLLLLWLVHLLRNKSTSCCGTVRAPIGPFCLHMSCMWQKDRLRVEPAGPSGTNVCRHKRCLHADNLPQTRGCRAVIKLPAILDYKKNMGAVDHHDQQLQPFDATRKPTVWYKKWCVHFLLIAMLNTCILSKKADNCSFRLDFQKDVIKWPGLWGQGPWECLRWPCCLALRTPFHQSLPHPLFSKPSHKKHSMYAWRDNKERMQGTINQTAPARVPSTLRTATANAAHNVFTSDKGWVREPYSWCLQLVWCCDRLGRWCLPLDRMGLTAKLYVSKKKKGGGGIKIKQKTASQTVGYNIYCMS